MNDDRYIINTNYKEKYSFVYIPDEKVYFLDRIAIYTIFDIPYFESVKKKQEAL